MATPRLHPKWDSYEERTIEFDWVYSIMGILSMTHMMDDVCQKGGILSDTHWGYDNPWEFRS